MAFGLRPNAKYGALKLAFKESTVVEGNSSFIDFFSWSADKDRKKSKRSHRQVNYPETPSNPYEHR